MISIVVCDDDLAVKNFSKYIEECIEKLERPASLVFYNDSEAFYQDVKQGMHVDILVSDIEMPVMNGFQLAENMHSLLPDILIIFITDYESYVYDSFKVQPFRFIPKVKLQERLPEALQDAVSKIIKSRERYLLIETPEGIEKILISQIVHIWHREKYAYIEKANGDTLKIRTTMQELSQKLPMQEFQWADRGHIINFYYVSSIKNCDIYLRDGRMVQVSRKRVPGIKQALQKYWLR